MSINKGNQRIVQTHNVPLPINSSITHARQPSSDLTSAFRHILILESQTNAVDTMSLVRRRRVPLPLEHMSQMPSTIATHDFRPGHPERAIRMPRHRARDAIEIGRPSAAGLELVGRFVQRRVAAGTGVDAIGGHVLVVHTGVGGFGALFAEDAELLFAMRLFSRCMPLRTSGGGVEHLPLFSTARHSSSPFCTGYDMLFEFELVKREPMNGIVGIDLRTAPRAKGARAL